MKESKKIKQWSKIAQRVLRALGIYVDVTHTRHTPEFAFVQVKENGVVEYDNFLSKKEFISQIADTDYLTSNELLTVTADDYGKVIGATGGFTTVVLKFHDGSELRGKYNYGANKNFFKAKGIANAIKRVLCENKLYDIYDEIVKANEHAPLNKE